MIVKSGVSMYQVHPNIEKLWPTLDRISETHCGRACVVTTCRDGIHSKNSLHYVGQAIDIRINDLPSDDAKVAYFDEVRRCLGVGYDVVLEHDHIHIEWDPK